MQVQSGHRPNSGISIRPEQTAIFNDSHTKLAYLRNLTPIRLIGDLTLFSCSMNARKDNIQLKYFCRGLFLCGAIITLLMIDDLLDKYILRNSEAILK